jgi:hypothetical protein
MWWMDATSFPSIMDLIILGRFACSGIPLLVVLNHYFSINILSNQAPSLAMLHHHVRMGVQVIF